MALIEERCYLLKPEFTPQAYLEIFERDGLELQRSILGDLAGYFVTEVGELNGLVNLWRYECFEERQRRRMMLAAEPQWQIYLKQIRPMLHSMTNRLLVPTHFSPIK